MKIIVEGRTHPSLNTWTNWHWAKKSRVKKSWENEIYYLCNKFNQPELKEAIVDITYYFKSNRRRDRDNYTPKFILDGLVKAGVIVDDSDNNLYLNWKLKVDKDNPRTEIEVREVS